jgi:hypothetical protein
MKKINLFFILAFEEQTNIYFDEIQKNNKLHLKNMKVMETTLTCHYAMLSQYFNLFNYYQYKDNITDFDNAIIYHLPDGKDNIKMGVEIELLKYKGKIPIVMMSYDAHSPVKTSLAYMTKYHDLVLTYFTNFINNENILFANLNYDNYLIYKNKEAVHYSKKKLACMILRKETRQGYFEDSDKFGKNGLSLKKIYGLREEIVKLTQIDIYGRNWPNNMVNYKGKVHPHLKKYTLMKEYKFNIAMENAIVDNYLSEKILDPMISLSVPVYIGSPKVDKWIPKSCFIDIRDFNSLEEMVIFLENMDEKTYNQYIENILKFRDEIFEKFSTKNNFAKPIYKWYKENYDNNLQYNEAFFDSEENKIKQLKLKKENKLEVFTKRLSKYIKRKLTF